MEVIDHCEPAHVQELLDRGERFWMALQSPDDETLHTVGQLLGLNPLAVEDSCQFGQRPKIDDYPDSALLVFFGARSQGPEAGEDAGLPEPVEVHFHITAKAVLTVRRTDLTTLDGARRRIALRDVDTAEEALYRVLDALAASFADPLQEIERELDVIEDELLDSSRPQTRLRLLDIKHSLVRMRHVVDPQRDVLAGHRDLLDQLPGFHDPGAHNILRDLYDRLSLTSQQLDSVREMVFQRPRSLRVGRLQPAQRNHEGAHDRGHVLPAADLHHGLLRAELRVDGGARALREAFLILGPGIAIVFVVALFATFVRAGFITIGRPSRAAARDRRAASVALRSIPARVSPLPDHEVFTDHGR